MRYYDFTRDYEAADSRAPWWLYRARPNPESDHNRGVVDGDTLDVLIDQGLHNTRRARLRLTGVDTAEVWGVEHGTEEYREGRAQTEWVVNWMHDARRKWDADEWPLVVATEQDSDGKFGRYLASVVRRADGHVLNEQLAKKWPEVADGDE